MPSLVIYGDEFSGYLENGLAPELFTYRFLAEGDSWMDRSSMFHASLLLKLAERMDAAGNDVLIINLAHFGDTMRRMGDTAGGDFRQWISTAFAWKFDAVLLSGGGNDFIDAARDPDPGKGILRDLAVVPAPAMGRDCLDRNAVRTLVTQYLNPSFSALHSQIQSSRHAGIPCFLNCYEVPTARPAPAFEGGRSWLFESYTKNSIPFGLWPDLTTAIFDEVQGTVTGWAAGHGGLHCVPTRGTLIAAAAGSTGSNGDWLNEIHPNASGWGKLAEAWQATMSGVLP